MTIEQDARAEAASYARHAIGGMQPVETIGDKVRAAYEQGYLAGAQRAANVGEPPRDFHYAGANEGAPAVTDEKIGRPASPVTREELADAIREDAYDSWDDVPEDIADALLARFNITARSEGGQS